MVTQCELILHHLKTRGCISHKEAENEYGIARLASRINDLRRQGVAIQAETVTGKNRFGKTTRYAVYKLAKEEEA